MIVNGVPAVCVPIAPPLDDSTKKLFNTHGLTVNVLLVPDSNVVGLVAVIVKLPVLKMVTL